MRASSSSPVAFGNSCATSQPHSPTKTSSRAAARICGRPKRCDEKIPPIDRRDCFTMSRRDPKTAMDLRPEGNPPQPAPEQHQPRPSPALLSESLFADANGVRPVWRFLIYVALYYL